MSRVVWFPARTVRACRVRACTADSMPPGVDPDIRSAVQTVYTTDLGLPEEWTDAQRAEFIDAETEKITWMVRAHAETLSEHGIHDWAGRHGGQPPSPSTQTTFRLQARAQAVRQVLGSELYELIAAPDAAD